MLKQLSNRYLLLFLIVISSGLFQSKAHAQPKNQLAEEYRAVGFAEQQKGNLVSALDYYAKAMLLEPNNARLLNDMGIVYERLEFYPKAEVQYLLAIKADGNFLPAYMNLGYFYLKTGYSGKAFNYFKQRYELGDKSDPWTLAAKEEMLKINPDYDRVVTAREVEMLNQELAAHGQDEFYDRLRLAFQHYKKGQEWIAQRNPEKAVQEFDAALVYTPDNPKIVRAREQIVLEMTATELKNKTVTAPKREQIEMTTPYNQDYQGKLSINPNERFISK